VVGTPWDARTYDLSSQPQQAWASEVLTRLEGIARDATVLDVGCGTGRVTEALLALVPQGRVLAMDASADMVALARSRLGDRAEVWCEDVLQLDLDEPVDAIVSTATLHWITDHDRLWARLAQALRPGGVFAFPIGAPPPIASRWYWALLGFDLAMRVRNAVRRPPFVMYYRTCPLQALRADLAASRFAVTTVPLTALGQRADGSPRFRLVLARA